MVFVGGEHTQVGSDVGEEDSRPDALTRDVGQHHVHPAVGKQQKVVVIASDLGGRLHGGVPADSGPRFRQDWE